MLVLVVLVFALDAARVRSVDAAAGALWVAMVFAGMLGANRALLAERDNGAIRGLLLSPRSRHALRRQACRRVDLHGSC